MHPHSVHIKNIKQANEEDRLAIFVGAGVSKSSDTDYIRLPSWSDLITEIKSDLGVEGELDYLKLAQLYYLEFGEQTYIQTLRKYFPEDIVPSILHKKILNLSPRVIITTNWDCIIENAIEQEGYLYDTICTDKDLVKSTSQSKFIKIHGDFKNHNIVFKEDDYLNYSRNFPLIENYIKSIFSTHTVLFLGYSYNDINLKHIMKWMQSHSTSAPPMYLVSFYENKPQESYLRNHGITTLVLESDDESNSDATFLDKRSELTKSFLESIIQDSVVVDTTNEQEVVNAIHERIEHLKEQNLITHGQIRRAITNCGFYYDRDGLAILDLFQPKGVLSTDYDKNTRLVHEKFVEIISRLDLLDSDGKGEFYTNNPRIVEIFSILALAKIKGILLSDENKTGNREYFFNEKIDPLEVMEVQDREHISFSSCECKGNNLIKSLASQVFEGYKRGQYKTAFEKNSELILACKRHRIYSMLLIALFNKNSLLWILKYSFSSVSRYEFQYEVEAKLQDEFFKFPKSEIKKNQELYDFLSLCSVHQKASECTKRIIKISKTIESIKAGGFSYSSDASKPTSEHVNLLMFSLKNQIIIDQEEPFRAAMRDFFKISILRQSLNTEVKFNQYEIYSAIQFFSSDDLKSELEIFLVKKGSSQLHLMVEDGCLKWVVNIVLPNLIGRLINDKNVFNGYDIKLQNCVVIISLIDLHEDYISKVMNEFSRLIASRSTTIPIYRAINEFFAHQYNLFKKNIGSDLLVELLNTLIDKVVNKTAHKFDTHAITYKGIENLYEYINVAKIKYKDVDRVVRLVSVLKGYNLELQRKYSQTILYSIFMISNSKVKKVIKRFIKRVVLKLNEKNVSDLEFELWSVAVGFKNFDIKVAQRLDGFVEQFRDGKVFDSRLISIKKSAQYLVENKNINELRAISDELSTLIENSNNNRSKGSSF
ncbi:SIR2 family protein [Vreelandella venusta]|uniref:SIR2-like domain-containing protein n=1 Tax=Vreelandella venusta TaxID=44935 RepID=A0ABX2B956_9GAMM|nr:SIR2 family protein [Halomonas venusta]AZM95294.1 hypothetical protein EI420_06145 [Halomonas venusta]NPT29811.1 hypothetical protein [Halomonas venusta]